MGWDSRAAEHMRRALELARLGWGNVHPNPLVGAVVVRDGTVVGEGYHERYGGPHAEVAALRAAGDLARGATLYVTLEPCAHQGKTPPCTDAILLAGITQVVYATEDPHTSAGGGAARLRASGVEVHAGLERSAARDLNAAFFHVHESGAPYLALKLALSLDGRIAAHSGARTTITGPEAISEVQRLRAGYDAILVGRGTVSADDPLLTVRDVATRAPPVRIIIDSAAQLDPASRLVQTIAQAPVWIVSAAHAERVRTDALQARGVRVLHAASGPDGVELGSALHELAQAGIGTIFAEGGGRIASALLREDRVQRMFLFIAPFFLGSAGVPAYSAAEPSRRWRLTREQRFGDDVLLTLDRSERS